MANPIKVIGSDDTEVILISREGVLGKFEGSKWEMARKIIERLSSE